LSWFCPARRDHRRDSANSVHPRSGQVLIDARQYSLVHFERMFANPLVLRSVINTMEVGLITAVAGGVLAFAIGYTWHAPMCRDAGRSTWWRPCQWRSPARGCVGLSLAWIGLPGGPIRARSGSSPWAFIRAFHPDTVKALSTSLMQIHRELEEASVAVRAAAHSPPFRLIVLPLARPGVVAAMTLLFILAIRELGSYAVPLQQ